jgi:hypothetical protein
VLPAAAVPSGQYAWWSERGNDFGCSPEGGHNLDIALPGLESLAPGTPVKLTFKSRWDMEWDFDYGFTLVTTNGSDYPLPSAKSHDAMAQNPNSRRASRASTTAHGHERLGRGRHAGRRPRQGYVREG